MSRSCSASLGILRQEAQQQQTEESRTYWTESEEKEAERRNRSRSEVNYAVENKDSGMKIENKKQIKKGKKPPIAKNIAKISTKMVSEWARAK